MSVGWYKNRYIEQTKSEIEFLEKDSETRAGVMCEISTIIKWCTEHGINPMHILEEAFPRYEWRAKKVPNTEELSKEGKDRLLSTLKDNDFMWYHWGVLVTARRRNRRKFLSYCWVSELYNYSDPAVKIITNSCTYIKGEKGSVVRMAGTEEVAVLVKEELMKMSSLVKNMESLTSRLQ